MVRIPVYGSSVSSLTFSALGSGSRLVGHAVCPPGTILAMVDGVFVALVSSAPRPNGCPVFRAAKAKDIVRATAYIAGLSWEPADP